MQRLSELMEELTAVPRDGDVFVVPPVTWESPAALVTSGPAPEVPRGFVPLAGLGIRAGWFRVWVEAQPCDRVSPAATRTLGTYLGLHADRG